MPAAEGGGSRNWRIQKVVSGGGIGVPVRDQAALERHR
jgi:hypothetical protein